MFTDKEKEIFKYELPDGEKRFVDPLRIRRKLAKATAGKIDELLQKQNSDNLGDQLDADEKLIPAVAFAFDLPMIDPKTGEGTPEQFLLNLLDEYTLWISEKKNPIVTLPTLPAPSG